MSSDWRSQADARINTLRKGEFRITLSDRNGKPFRGRVGVHQVRSHFHFGVCVGGDPGATQGEEARYGRFILDHFNTLVCENAMKWYDTEREKDRVSYENADRLMSFAEANDLAMRGHCIFWEAAKYVQPWIQELSDDELRRRVDRRLEEIVTRYRGRLIAWDVNNEMLDHSFYKDRLGDEIRAYMFKRAHELDPSVTLFVNDYSILVSDQRVEQYIAQVRHLQSQGAPVGGIGVQMHNSQRLLGRENTVQPDEVLRRLDRLATLKLPIHLTEISSQTPDEQHRADSLEALFRICYSHPAVEAILLWGFWAQRHWLGREAALVDEDFTPLPAGQRISGLLREEWRTNLPPQEVDGELRFRGFFGRYDLTVEDGAGAPRTVTVNLTPDTKSASVVI